MQTISIGTEHRAEEIIERLDEGLRSLRREGFDVRMGLHSRGRFTFLDCSVHPQGPDTEALLRHTVASALSDVIVDKWEKDLVRRMIHGQYCYFSREEQDRILDHADRNLGGEGATAHDRHSRSERKARVLSQLREYLDQNSELVVEGFVHFRLRDYLEELEDAVDRAVDDFLTEREEREFVRLLRYFLDVQEPRVDEVHVRMRPGGSFSLVDPQGHTLRSEVLEQFVVEMVESEVSYEDLLISALITLAPRRVVIHGSVPPVWEGGVATIRGVFGDRLRDCPGCALCDMEVSAPRCPTC